MWAKVFMVCGKVDRRHVHHANEHTAQVIRKEAGREPTTEATELSEHLQDRPAPTRAIPGRFQPNVEAVDRRRKGRGRGQQGKQSNADVWGCRPSALHYIISHWIEDQDM